MRVLYHDNMVNALDNTTDKEFKMVHFKLQFSDDRSIKPYNFPNAASAIRFLSDVNRDEWNPVMLLDVHDVDLHEWISDFVESDKNRVLEYVNPQLMGRRHAAYTMAMWNRIGRCARPIK